MEFQPQFNTNIIFNEEEMVCVIMGHIRVGKSTLFNKLCNFNSRAGW